MIYVTVGTMFLDFPRLIREVDQIAVATDERVIVQAGLCTTLPAHCEYFDFKSHEEVMAIQRQARVVVCHAGIGTILDALAARRPTIVVPRRKQFNEHLTDHQMDLAQAVHNRGWARMVLDMGELPDACAHPPDFPDSYAPARHRLIRAVRDSLDRVATMKALGIRVRLG